MANLDLSDLVVFVSWTCTRLGLGLGLVNNQSLFLLTFSVTSNLFLSSILTSREYSRRNIFLSKEIFYRIYIEQMKENLVLFTRDCNDSFPWSGSFTSSSLSSAEDSSPYLKNRNSNVLNLF